MVYLKKKLFLQIAVLAGFLSIAVYLKIKENFKKTENLKVVKKDIIFNYQIEDTIKEYKNENILEKREEFVKNARNYLDMRYPPYQWVAKNTKDNSGIDCLGLIFLAHSKTYGKNWTEISDNPREIIKKEQLGKPVKALEGVLTEDIDFSKLKQGDIIYLLTEKGEINEFPLAEINGKKYWPKHAGIYSDKKNNLFLHVNPKNKVVEENFKKYLKEKTKAIFVTRIY